MQRVAAWRKHFNWRMLLMRTLINGLVLLLAVLVVPKVSFVEHRFGTLFLLAVVLGLLNAFVKPVIQFAMLRFIFATYGVVIALINAVVLLLLALLLPNRFAVDSLFWALVAGAMMGILSALLENLLGLTPPIVSEKYPEIREMIKEREVHRVAEYVARAEAKKTAELPEGIGEANGGQAAADAAAVLAAVSAEQAADERDLAPAEDDSAPVVDEEPATDQQEA